MTSQAMEWRSQRQFPKHAEPEMVDEDGEEALPAGPALYQSAGEVSLAGYTATRFVVPGSELPELILSDLPELRPLGAAVATYSSAIERMVRQNLLEETNAPQLLADKGVLGFWGFSLSSVDFTPIDSARFQIPSDPVTLAMLLAEEEEPSPDPAIKELPTPSVIAAVFQDHTLITLTEDGALHAAARGATGSTSVQGPGKVRAICALRGELLIVTETDAAAGNLQLWSGSPEKWTLETSLSEADGAPFSVLDCTGDEPVLVTKTAIHRLRSKEQFQRDPTASQRGAFAATLQLNGYLYLGLNAGEWGGGLRRISLEDGSEEAIDASDPTEICGGKLNTACDSVTGLAPDPVRPGCILASVGLVHLFPSGKIVRICGKSVELVYYKPYTLNPDWETNPTPEDQARLPSVPFFSLASTKGGVLAVGNDGVYRFTGLDRPEFQPFSPMIKLRTGRIDWSHPDFALITTNMNQRHSLSGASLILVPTPD